jgi:hypothetical protein
MERSTTEVNLPTSGMKAVVYDVYTRGERKAIEAIMLESAVFEQDENNSPRLKSVDPTYRSRMEDKAVLLAVKNFIGKDGSEVKAELDVLDSLPNEDFELLQQSLPGQSVKKK